jgi:hypothetical protein
MSTKNWPQTTATIQRCDWQKKPWYHPSPGHYRVVFIYNVNDTPQRGEYKALLPEEIGAEFPLLYNPTNPAQNEKSFQKRRDRILTIAGFAILATGTLLYTLLHGWQW